MLTEIHDVASGHVWPGAMARVQRNAVIEPWAGREWAVRQNRAEIASAMAKARTTGDVNNATLLFGQDAGLIKAVLPAAETIETMAREADEIIPSA